MQQGAVRWEAGGRGRIAAALLGGQGAGQVGEGGGVAGGQLQDGRGGVVGQVGRAGAQERAARLVQSAVDDLKAAGEGQTEAARALLSPPAWATGATTVTEPFTQLMQAWTDTFTRFSGGGTADPRSS